MIEITQVAYYMDMGCGMDVWRVTGRLDGKYINPSTPVSCNPNEDTFVTKSGSVYKILSYARPKEEFFKQLEKDIKMGHYEVH